MMFGKATEMVMEEAVLFGDLKTPHHIHHTSLKISCTKHQTILVLNQVWNSQMPSISLLTSIVRDL